MQLESRGMRLVLHSIYGNEDIIRLFEALPKLGVHHLLFGSSESAFFAPRSFLLWEVD